MTLLKKFSPLLISLVLALGFGINANAQTVTVSGHVNQVFGTAIPGTSANGIKVCFRATDSVGNPLGNARIVGGGTMPFASVSGGNCVSPDGSGFFTTALVANDQIENYGSVGTTLWMVTFTKGGQYLAGSNYFFTLADGIENLDTKSPSSIVPVVPAPTGDNTYCRIDASNCGFTNDPSAPGYRIIEGTAPTGSAAVDILYADSSLHRPRFINNNGSAASVALLSDSIGSFTGTLTSAQLAALITDETGTGPDVFANGSVIAPTSVTTGQFIQPAATTATWKDNTGGTRASIPSNGTGQGTLNNWQIGGGSTFTTTNSFQKFTSSGTFTIPANVTSVEAIIVAGGGAGGGATTTAGSGAGGMGGGYAIKLLTGLTPGNTITVTVGTGGAGSANAAGGNGGNSSISSGTQTITTVTANGGSGGNITGIGPPTSAGLSTNGDINGAPSFGQIASFSNSGGTGGPSLFGGGGNQGTGSAGVAGNAPGSGGGGAGGTAGGAVSGGAGANGTVIFRWTN